MLPSNVITAIFANLQVIVPSQCLLWHPDISRSCCLGFNVHSASCFQPASGILGVNFSIEHRAALPSSCYRIPRDANMLMRQPGRQLGRMEQHRP